MSALRPAHAILTQSSSAKGPNGWHKEEEEHGDGDVAERPVTPSLSHRLKHNRSILAIVVSATCIFAGTEDGEILVRLCMWYEEVA